MIGIEYYIESTFRFCQFQLRKIRLKNGEIILLNVMESSFKSLNQILIDWADFIVISYFIHKKLDLNQAINFYEFITNYFIYKNILVLGCYQSYLTHFVYLFILFFR